MSKSYKVKLGEGYWRYCFRHYETKQRLSQDELIKVNQGQSEVNIYVPPHIERNEEAEICIDKMADIKPEFIL